MNNVFQKMFNIFHIKVELKQVKQKSLDFGFQILDFGLIGRRDLVGF